VTRNVHLGTCISLINVGRSIQEFKGAHGEEGGPVAYGPRECFPNSYLGSQKCLTTQRSCQYAPVTIPLRDRRIVQRNAIPPGQQAPWEFANTSAIGGVGLTGSTSMDPFDVFPIKMPFKSQELYHYCMFYVRSSGQHITNPLHCRLSKWCSICGGSDRSKG
jgi:hypothetical protein